MRNGNLTGPAQAARLGRYRRFASRESGVRVPLAPLVRDKIRTAGAGSTAAKYRNRDCIRCSTCVRAGLRHRGRQPQIPGLEADFRATERGERLREGLAPLARRPRSSVQSMPFRGRPSPLIQRVSPGETSQVIHVTDGDPIARCHQWRARMSPTLIGAALARLRSTACADDPVLSAVDGPGDHGVCGCSAAARLPRLSGEI